METVSEGEGGGIGNGIGGGGGIRHETVKYFVGKSLLKMFLKILKTFFENT